MTAGTGLLWCLVHAGLALWCAWLLLSTPGSSSQLMPVAVVGPSPAVFLCLHKGSLGMLAAAIMWESYRLDQAIVWAQDVDHAVSHAARFAHMMQPCSCFSGLIIGSVASVASMPNAAPVSVRTLYCGVPTPQRATPCICSVCCIELITPTHAGGCSHIRPSE